METEKIKAGDVEVGDRISLDNINKPAFTVVDVEHGRKILGIIDAVRLTVVNDHGRGLAKNLGVRRPLKRRLR